MRRIKQQKTSIETLGSRKKREKKSLMKSKNSLNDAFEKERRELDDVFAFS